MGQRKQQDLGQPAAEHLHDDTAVEPRNIVSRGAIPAAKLDPAHVLDIAAGVDVRRDERERRHAVAEEAHGKPVLHGELARETPCDAGVAVVVDDDAEDVPASRRNHVGSKGVWAGISSSMAHTCRAGAREARERKIPRRTK